MSRRAVEVDDTYVGGQARGVGCGNGAVGCSKRAVVGSFHQVSDTLTRLVTAKPLRHEELTA